MEQLFDKNFNVRQILFKSIFNLEHSSKPMAEKLVFIHRSYLLIKDDYKFSSKFIKDVESRSALNFTHFITYMDNFIVSGNFLYNVVI